MKTVVITTMMVALGLTLNAQNTNVTKATKTTVVTVNDGSQPKKLVKTENTQAVNEIELKDADSKKLNKDSQETPVQVSTSTTVAADSGFNPRIGQITNYQMGGKTYLFISDKAGFNVKSPDNKDLGKLRRTSNNNYIYKTPKATSIGHFDANGNFVVETYDDKTDGVTVETYTVVRQ